MTLLETIQAMDRLAWLQLLGSLGFTLALFPQFIHTLRRRRSDDMDVSFLLLVLVSSVVLLFYMIPTKQYFLASTYVANLIVWGTVLYYRLRPQPTSPLSLDPPKS